MSANTARLNRPLQVVPRRFTSLDLFSGAGGFSLGLEAAGFRSLGAVEIDTAAAATYRRNFAERPANFLGPDGGDISQLSPRDVKAALGLTNDQPLDLLVAGPPCQGFSQLGRAKLNSLAARADAFLEDQRNKLYHRAIHFLEELQPRAFLLENVPGMLYLGDTNVAELVCEAARRRGYRVRCALLNAAWYGVPQTRERLFIIGLRDELGEDPQFPIRTHRAQSWKGSLSTARAAVGEWAVPEYFVTFEQLAESETVRPAVTVGEAFADLPAFRTHLRSLESGERYRSLRDLHPAVAYASEATNEFCKQMRHWPGLSPSKEVSDHFCRWTPRDFETFGRMKCGDTYSDALEIAEARWREECERRRELGIKEPLRQDYIPPYSSKSFDEKWRKLHPDRPSWTVTAHLGKDTYSHIHFDSSQKRAITVREAARLQSFPDGFIFSGNMGDAFRQIGNAVPPLLARALGEAIRDQLLELDRKAHSRPERSDWPGTAVPLRLNAAK